LVEIAKVDVQMAAGYRASKVMGSSVVNDANDPKHTTMLRWVVFT
jgi:hypothetical protein